MSDKNSDDKEKCVLSISSERVEKLNESFYGFSLQTFVNHIFTLNLLVKTYNDLKNDVNHDEKLSFEIAVKSLTKELFPKCITYECDSPIKCFVNIDEEFLNLFVDNKFRNYLRSKAELDLPSYFQDEGVLSLKNVLEYRIGLKMSTDDSYDLFGITSFISKANDTTAVFYSGSKVAKTLRPYLIPSDEFIEKFNKKADAIDNNPYRAKAYLSLNYNRKKAALICVIIMIIK